MTRNSRNNNARVRKSQTSVRKRSGVKRTRRRGSYLPNRQTGSSTKITKTRNKHHVRSGRKRSRGANNWATPRSTRSHKHLHRLGGEHPNRDLFEKFSNATVTFYPHYTNLNFTQFWLNYEKKNENVVKSFFRNLSNKTKKEPEEYKVHFVTVQLNSSINANKYVCLMTTPLDVRAPFGIQPHSKYYIQAIYPLAKLGADGNVETPGCKIEIGFKGGLDVLTFKVSEMKASFTDSNKDYTNDNGGEIFFQTQVNTHMSYVQNRNLHKTELNDIKRFLDVVGGNSPQPPQPAHPTTLLTILLNDKPESTAHITTKKEGHANTLGTGHGFRKSTLKNNDSRDIEERRNITNDANFQFKIGKTRNPGKYYMLHLLTTQKFPSDTNQSLIPEFFMNKIIPHSDPHSDPHPDLVPTITTIFKIILGDENRDRVIHDKTFCMEGVADTLHDTTSENLPLYYKSVWNLLVAVCNALNQIVTHIKEKQFDTDDNKRIVDTEFATSLCDGYEEFLTSIMTTGYNNVPQFTNFCTSEWNYKTMGALYETVNNQSYDTLTPLKYPKLYAYVTEYIKLVGSGRLDRPIARKQTLTNFIQATVQRNPNRVAELIPYNVKDIVKLLNTTSFRENLNGGVHVDARMFVNYMKNLRKSHQGQRGANGAVEQSFINANAGTSGTPQDTVYVDSSGDGTSNHVVEQYRTLSSNEKHTISRELNSDPLNSDPLNINQMYISTNHHIKEEDTGPAIKLLCNQQYLIDVRTYRALDDVEKLVFHAMGHDRTGYYMLHNDSNIRNNATRYTVNALIDAKQLIKLQQSPQPQGLPPSQSNQHTYTNVPASEYDPMEDLNLNRLFHEPRPRVTFGVSS